MTSKHQQANYLWLFVTLSMFFLFGSARPSSTTSKKPQTSVWTLVKNVMFVVKKILCAVFFYVLLRRFTLFIGSKIGMGKFEMWIYLTPINFLILYFVRKKSVITREEETKNVCIKFQRWQRVMRMWWRWLKAYLSHTRWARNRRTEKKNNTRAPYD